MSVRASADGFVEAAFGPTSTVQSYVVYTNDLRCAPLTCAVDHGAQGGPTFFRSRGHPQQCSSVPMCTLVVHNVALHSLGGAHDNLSCS